MIRRKTVICILRNMCKLFCIVPLKQNRISVIAYHGDGYMCSPKYISEYLTKHYKGRFQIIWGMRDPADYMGQVPAGVKVVKYKTLSYIYYSLTSKFRITNSEEWIVLPQRKGQQLINTWHGGGAYKKVAYDAETVKNILCDDYYNKSTLFLSSCGAASNYVYRGGLHFNGRILNCGLPRNDILIENNGKKRAGIRAKLGIKEGCRTVLYAPTFREEAADGILSLDGRLLIHSLQEKFGGRWSIMARKHLWTTAGKGAFDFFAMLGEHMDVSLYPDMQELLLAADILVTDYSSSVWDFSFTFRPVFLYTPDIGHYGGQGRGFYTDIYTWGFPVCTTNEDLKAGILDFKEEEYRKKVLRHHEIMESYESGKAARIIGEYIWKESHTQKSSLS